MEFGKAFGQVLKAHRTEAGFSQEELAFRADMHSTTISLYERGGRQPTLHTVFILAKALELQPDAIVREVQELKPAVN
jgi:transcriptional regulator with XRE-family HTH domain